jgi:hypothetical protein
MELVRTQNNCISKLNKLKLDFRGFPQIWGSSRKKEKLGKSPTSGG